VNPDSVRTLLEIQGVEAGPAHVDAAVSALDSMLKATAERFSRLPLEAEPSGFQAEQRKIAP
jgi:hypothetical protein